MVLELGKGRDWKFEVHSRKSLDSQGWNYKSDYDENSERKENNSKERMNRAIEPSSQRTLKWS